MQWYIIYWQRDQIVLRKHTDLRDEERIQAREINQQNDHIYEHHLKNVKLR